MKLVTKVREDRGGTSWFLGGVKEDGCEKGQGDGFGLVKKRFSCSIRLRELEEQEKRLTAMPPGSLFVPAEFETSRTRPGSKAERRWDHAACSDQLPCRVDERCYRTLSGG